MIFPVITQIKETTLLALKDVSDVKINQVLDLLQANASYTDIKIATYLPTYLIREIETNAHKLVAEVSPLIKEAKTVTNLKQVQSDVERKDLIIDKMVKLSSPDGNGTITTLKQAVGVDKLIQPIGGDDLIIK